MSLSLAPIQHVVTHNPATPVSGNRFPRSVPERAVVAANLEGVTQRSISAETSRSQGHACKFHALNAPPGRVDSREDAQQQWLSIEMRTGGKTEKSRSRRCPTPASRDSRYLPAATAD
jgi:hypothetical protein